jgi:hypothetical protein
MSFGARELFFDLGSQTDGLVSSKNLGGTSESFFEGDTYTLRVHLRKKVDSGSEPYHLDTNETLALALSLEDDLRQQEQTVLAYTNTFDSVLDADGDICYETQWELNTEEIITALGTRSSINCVVEMVILDGALGRQYTVQGSARVRRSIVDTQNVNQLGLPSVNIGSFSTVKELCENLVDERIIGLKDGAPVEFDTLFELAEAAMGMQSLRAEVGTYADYIEGKALADSGLTVTALGAIAADGASVTVVI